MREIKFRGRDEHGEWHYGAFMGVSYDGVVAPIEYANIYDDGMASRVFPDTVGQYTGLLDADGREIYEGDILSLREGSDEMIKVIDFYAAITTLDLFEMMNLRLLGYYFERGEVHVIGNVHDNPDLLEVEHD